jgi:hypothetical protein
MKLLLLSASEQHRSDDGKNAQHHRWPHAFRVLSADVRVCRTREVRRECCCCHDSERLHGPPDHDSCRPQQFQDAGDGCEGRRHAQVCELLHNLWVFREFPDARAGGRESDECTDDDCDHGDCLTENEAELLARLRYTRRTDSSIDRCEHSVDVSTVP